jgi:hypothetical protein
MIRMRISSPCASDAISNSTCEGWSNSPAGFSCSILMLSNEIVLQELSALFSLKGLLHERKMPRSYCTTLRKTIIKQAI